MKKKEITKDMTIGEVMKSNEKLADVFMGFGMHCFSCPVSQMETIEQAAAAHGVELDFMLKKLNEDLEPADAKPAKRTCGCKSKKESK